MSTPAVVDVLREARRLIAEVGWTQVVGARDARDCCVPVKDPAACKFCLLGALIRAGMPPIGPLYDHIDGLLQCVVRPFQSYIGWNDAPGRSREEVIALLDRVITEQEGVAQ